jgi:mono/diheme cytochrome c family protein
MPVQTRDSGFAIRQSSARARRIVAMVLMIAAPIGAQAPSAAARATGEVTYSRDVAPIFQQKCQECHQPNSIAPMSLLTYDDAKKFATRIKARVAARVMPPWHLDKTVGIQEFRNDRSLSDEQIATIVKWVDTGAPRGNPADEPPPVTFGDPTQWQLSKTFGKGPDLIVKSTPYTLAAQTQDKWFRPVVETGLTEPRWVRAIEVRPSWPDGRRIVHHVLTYLLQEEQGITNLASTAHGHQMSAGLFMEWAVGKVGEVFAPDAGKLMLPGSKIRWEVHMHAIGQEVKDNQVELGVYFYPKDYVPKYRTVLRMFDATAGGENLDIPPRQKSMTQNFFVLQAPARLENFQPHMHMRGKAMSLEAIHPDGRREVLNHANNFQWNWHVNYIYADGAAPLLPKGTTLVLTAWHDNTEQNPNNPDPDQWVGWGDRTVDEMAHLWVDVTYLEQAEFDRLTAERKAKKALRTESPARHP